MVIYRPTQRIITTLASLNLAVATYNLTQTYDGAGFTYASQDAQDFVRSLFVSEPHGSGSHNVSETLVFDNVDDGSIGKPVASRVLNASFGSVYKSIWRARNTLIGFKTIRNIYPQSTTSSGTLTFNFGASNIPTDNFVITN